MKDIQSKYTEIINILDTLYPDAECALNHRTPFELLVATIMSAQCTDVRVNIITDVMFKSLNTPFHYAALQYEQLESMIKTCGMYKIKSKSIINTSRILLDKYAGEVPQTMEELKELPGVGTKTASVVLSNAFGIPALAVDTHVFRVSNRLGLAEANNVEKTGHQLMERIPRDKWIRAHHQLIFHGRQVCAARKPKCDECDLAGLCKYYNNIRED